MRYRREDDDGDYSFGQGDNSWLCDSPDGVAQAVRTRFALWRGQWFLDTDEGTPWMQTLLSRQPPELYNMAIRERLLSTPGVRSLLSFDSFRDSSTRRLRFTATLDTLYGTTTVSSEA